MSSYVQLGKYGDQLSMLPILHDDFVRTGTKPVLMVSREYSSIAEKLDYVQPLVWDGNWQDLTGAVMYAKREFKNVFVTQTHGINFPIQHRTPSFQYDQWDRANKISSWDNLPLILPRPKDAKQIADKFLRGVPCILFADNGQSAPFKESSELLRLLQDKFGAENIVLLSRIRMENPLDFLALYDAADLLVTVDTIHLHLSKASSIPVIALTRDDPTGWHGSAWSNRFSFYCRYREFSRRKDELLRTAEIVTGSQHKPIISKSITSFKNGYNPSVVRIGKRVISTYRYHPDSRWQTRIAVCEGDRTWKLKLPSEYDDYSHEDSRLFIKEGEVWVSIIIATGGDVFRSIVTYGKLEMSDKECRISNLYQPKYDGNDFRSLVKNWLAFEHARKLMCIYGNRQNQQVVLQLDGDKVLAEHLSPEPTWKWGQIRGGAIIPWKNQYLRFFHSRTGSNVHKHGEFCYYIGASIMESSPPFKTVAVSKFPILAGSEKWIPNCHHWKPNVCFAAGVFEQDGCWHLSYGNNDCECLMAKLSEKDLNL